MVCCSSGAQNSNVDILGLVLWIHPWIGNHVCIRYFPLDIRAVAFFQLDGIWIGAVDALGFDLGIDMSNELWQRSASLL